MKIPKLPLKEMGGAGKLFFALKFVFVWLVLVWVFGSAIYQAVQQQDIKVFVVELGDQTYGSLLEAQNHAISVQEGSLWAFVLLLLAIWRLFLWFFVWMFLTDILLKDTTSLLIRVLVPLLIYVAFFIAYLGVSDFDVNLLWSAWGDIFRAFGHILSDKPSPNIFNENTCTTAGGCLV